MASITKITLCNKYTLKILDVVDCQVNLTPFELHFSVMHLSWFKEKPEDYVKKMKGTDKDLAANMTQTKYQLFQKCWLYAIYLLNNIEFSRFIYIFTFAKLIKDSKR